MTEPSRRRNWIPRPLVALLAVLVLAGTVAAITGYIYAQRRIAALAYLWDEHNATIMLAPAGSWAGSIRLPLWMRSVDEIQLRSESCDVRRFAALCEARTLDCHHCGIDHDGFRSLGAFRNLETLHLDHCGIRDDDLTVLRECPRLAELDLSRNELTDAGLSHLTPLPLQSLSLLGNDVTADAVPLLLRIPTLDNLTVSRPPFDEEHMRPLKARGVLVQYFRR